MIYAEPLSQIVHKLKRLLHATFVIANERNLLMEGQRAGAEDEAADCDNAAIHTQRQATGSKRRAERRRTSAPRSKCGAAMALVWRAISSPESPLSIARKPAGNCKEKPKSGGGRPKKHKITAKTGGAPCFFVVLLLSCFRFQTPPPWKSPSLFPALPRLLKPPLPIRPPTKSQGPSRRHCARRPWRSWNGPAPTRPRRDRR